MLRPPLLRARGVVKTYGGLRPLRLLDLALAPGDVVALGGPDETAASVLVDLLTGTTLPDAGGIVVNGSPTSAIADHEAWLRFLEQFGIVNPRVVLLDQMTVVQNLAVPLTLDLEPLSAPDRVRATAIARAVGLDGGVLDAPLAASTPLTRFHVRLGRAIAHDPRLLLIEHPTLGLPDVDALACAQSVRAVIAASGGALGVLVITGDARFARAAGARRLAWDAATGRVSTRGGGRWWFGAR